MTINNLTNLTSILFLTGILLIVIACTNTQNSDELTVSESRLAEEAALPLIYQMSFISRYTQKLYFAGDAKNWELADIYNHEIEEISEGIVAGDETHDGNNISQLMESMLLPQVERLEQAIDSGDREMFLNRYNVMIKTCNQCHLASDYGAVRVTVPETNPFSQDFSAD